MHQTDPEPSVSTAPSREKPRVDPEQLPILAVAYDEKTLNSLVNCLAPFNASVTACLTFSEAEQHALHGNFGGIIVDLATIIKAKGEEKNIAYSLVNFYPALRVKSLGPMLVPMAMSGDAKQDKSLADFMNKTCASFTARKLRNYKRREIGLSVVIGAGGGNGDGSRGFVRNASWGGLFIVHMHPEKHVAGDAIQLTFPDFDFSIVVSVVHVQAWGLRKTPGIGVVFRELDTALEEWLQALLKTDRNRDRDRLVV